MTYRVRNIVVAVVLAALAGALTLVYVVNYKRHVQHGENKVNVLVAARDIPAGTTGSEVVEQHMLKTEAVPRRTLVPGWIGDSDQLQNQVATQEIYAKEQISTRRFAPPREQGVRSLIRGTERAAEFVGDPHQVLAGTLKAGDYIDVVGSWTLPDGDQHHVTRVVIRNVLVLRAAPEVAEGAKLGPTAENSAVQLRLTDVQSQKMMYVYKNPTAAWYLQLRPPTKSTDSSNTFQQDHTMLFDGPGRRPH
jgi:Flp pilus assembly protein CpaB